MCVSVACICMFSAFAANLANEGNGTESVVTPMQSALFFFEKLQCTFTR